MRSCGLCQDKRRKEIDSRLLHMGTSKETYRLLSSEFKIHEATLRRHKKNCLTKDLLDVCAEMDRAREDALREVHAQELEVIKDRAADTISGRLEQATDVFEQLRILRDRAVNLLDQAEQNEDLRSAGIFLRELREQLKLLAELESTTRVITESPTHADHEGTVMDSLTDMMSDEDLVTLGNIARRLKKANEIQKEATPAGARKLSA